MNVGGFSQNQNKTSDTDRYKRYLFTARISQVNVNTTKRFFEQLPELRVARCLLVDVLSSSYNVSSLQLRNERKATQHWSLRVANDIVLNQAGVSHERMYADIVVSKFWFVRSFYSRHFSIFITNITSEKVSQIRTKECQTRSFICKANLKFLRSSRHFNCETVFAVIVSFFNESFLGFSNIRNGRVKTRFEIVEVWRQKKHKFSLRDIMVHGSWMDGIFPKLQPPIGLPDSIALLKSL